MQVLEPQVAYGALEENGVSAFIAAVRTGIPFGKFLGFANFSPFKLAEWAAFLHISERTMQRYEKEKRRFDALQSEKIIEIALLYKNGVAVFGKKEHFDTWLESTLPSLGNVTPKSLLDSSFGIRLLRDELIRIEHGVLA